MFNRDDLELFSYEYDEYTFHFRFLDTNIKTYDEGKYFHYTVPICEKDNKVKKFEVTFRVEADEIDTAYFKTIECIQKEMEKID